MKLTHEDHDNLRLIRLDGELHGQDTERLNALADEARQAGKSDLVVNLAQVSHVDSAGLELLLTIKDQCEATLGQLRLCGANENLRTVLRITRLRSGFQCDADEQAAIDGLCAI